MACAGLLAAVVLVGLPLTLLLGAVVVRRPAPPWVAGLLAVSAVAWPVAHIANIGWPAVLVNVGLTVAFGAVALSRPRPGDIDARRPSRAGEHAASS